MNFSRPKSLQAVILSLFMIAVLGLSAIEANAWTTDPYPYCDAHNYNAYTYKMYIEQIVLDGVNVMPAHTGDHYGYRYYGNDAPVSALIQGESYSITETAAGHDANNNHTYRQDIVVYMDLNQNYQFEDTEIIYSYDNNGSGPYVYNYNITIPLTAPLGANRLRFVCDYYGNSGTMHGCVTGSYSTYYGSIIDIPINIITPPDAGVLALAEPSDAFAEGEQEVAFEIFNYGDGDLFNCPIKWTVDNGATFTYYWDAADDPDGPIPTQDSRVVNVGTYEFLHKVDGSNKRTWEVYEIQAWTAITNDANKTNDGMISIPTVAPGLEPDTYYIGGVDADFEDEPLGRTALEVAMDYMSSAGIIGKGDVTFEFRPGTYNAIINLSGFDGSTNGLILRSQSGTPTGTTIHGVTTAVSPFVFNISNCTNVTVESLNFTVDGASGYGSIINIVSSDRIAFYNNDFHGVASCGKNEDNIIMNITDSYDITIGKEGAGNDFFEGSIAIAEINSTNMRKLNICHNNITDYQWYGIRLNGNNTGTQAMNDVMVANNTVKLLNPLYIPNFAIHSINGTTIQGNRISNMIYGGSLTAGIFVQHTNPDLTEGTTITENIITGGQDHYGIYTVNMPMLNVTNNDISINSFDDDTYAAIGMTLVSSGQQPVASNTNGFANVANNAIEITNATDRDYGMQIVGGSFVKSLYNNVNIGNGNPVAGTHAGLLLDNSTAYVANCWFSGENVNGIILNNPVNAWLMYNAVYINSAGGTSGALIVQDGTADIRRNLFINEGTALATIFVQSGVGTLDLTFEQNNLHSAGARIGIFVDNGIQNDLLITMDGDDIDSDATMTNFENMLGVGNGGALPTSNLAYEIIFESDVVLKTTNFVDGFVFDDPLPASAFGYNEFDAEYAALQQAMEAFGWEGQERTNKFQMGSNNVVPEINVTLQPENVVDCWNTPDHQVMVVSWITGGIQPKYEWYKDGKSLTELYDASNPGEDWAQKPILYLDDMVPFTGFESGLSYDMQGVYKCKISGGAADDVFSDEVLVNVIRQPEFTRKPQAIYGEEGGVVMFEAEAQMFGNVDIDDPKFDDMFQINVQWYDGSGTLPVAIEDNERIVGSNASILQIRDIVETDFHDGYYVRFEGHCGTIISDEVALMEYPKPVIDAQPTNVTICEGDDAVFGLSASIENGTADSELMYQWRVKDGDNYVDLMDDATYTNTSSATMTVTGGMDATFNCAVTVMPGDYTVISDDVTLTTMASATITAMDPVDGYLDVPAGSGTFTLSVTATGDGLSYDWFHVVDGNGEPVGEDNPVLTIESATFTDAHGGEYYCVVTGTCGEDQSPMFNVTITDGGIAYFDVEDANYGFELKDVVPNPVNNSANIEFNLDNAAQVTIILRDASGRMVAELYDAMGSAGYNSVPLNVKSLGLTSGTYFYTMIANGKSITKKVVVVK